MMTLHRSFVLTLLLLALGLATSSAAAAPRDAAAQRKIDEAINTHYLQTNFDQAESVLLGVVKACADKCSMPIKAKAWMYVGIVRGSGRNDSAGAAEAFANAVSLDPNVALDDALATPDTKKAFDEAKANAGAPSAPPAAPVPPAAPAAPAAAPPPSAGTMQCTPTVREVQTRRSIPISCETPQPAAAKGVLFYKEFGGDAFTEAPMQKKGTSFQGTIPCSATNLAGEVQFYLEARDANGNVVDMYGTRAQPGAFTITGATNQPPPAYPGMEPPPRCEEQADCPPDFPGCKGGSGNKEWGDSCAANDECQTNYCSAGSCEFCQDDGDCPGRGTCEDGFCSGGSGGGKGPGATGPVKKVWLGVHFGADLPIVGGDDICTLDSQSNNGWNCFYATPPQGLSGDVQYPYDPHPIATGKVNSGLSLATVRAMLSFDYAVSPHITLGARAGFAFNGGPDAEGASFLPVHAEGRFAYWFVPLNQTGLRPYVHLGGGLGQVDAKVDVRVLDCNNGEWDTLPTKDPCLADPTGQTGAPIELELEAYRRMGQLFVAPGGGVAFAFNSRAALQLNVDAKIMFPTTGFAVSPSLGFMYGL